jgi:hypothetical protein
MSRDYVAEALGEVIPLTGRETGYGAPEKDNQNAEQWPVMD